MHSNNMNICAVCINGCKQIEKRFLFCTIRQNQGHSHTRSATDGQGIGAVQVLAAARLIQLSGAFVAEVQTQATLMFGTKGEGKISPQ